MLCAKFDQNILNSLFCITFTRLFPYSTIDIYKAQPLRMDNTCTTFNWNTLNSKISIVFTSLFQYLSIVTLTFDFTPPRSIRLILWSWLVWRRGKQPFVLCCVHTVKVWGKQWHIDWQTHTLTEKSSITISSLQCKNLLMKYHAKVHYT